MPSLPIKHKPPQQPRKTHVESDTWGKGRGGRPWRRRRDLVLTRDRYLCQPCFAQGRYTEATEVDHVVSLSKGGTDSFDNLQAICSECHRAKTAQDRMR